MKNAYRIAILCLLFLVTATHAVLAQTGEEAEGRDLEFEQEIYDRLSEIDPAAVPLFQQATQAMDAGDFVTAKAKYEQVLALAPGFPDAARRLSYVEQALGNVALSVQYAELAFARDPSPYNESALARALLAMEDRSHLADALAHARNAAQALPDDTALQSVLLLAGVMNEDLDTIRQASDILVRLAPKEPAGHFFGGLIAAEDGRWIVAERKLLRAQELGWPAQSVQEMLDNGIRSQARTQRWLHGGLYSFLGWVASAGVLFAAGAVLSRLTLSTAYRAQPGAQFEISPGERRLRTVYRVVIALTSLYFYASIPLLILAVIGLAGGVFYLFYVVGRISVRIGAAVIVAALATMLAIVRCLFTRVRIGDPGRPLSRQEAPRLWALAERVAERVETRPIDAIYVTPLPEIAVTERGGLWKKLRGLGQRCLVLGLGALPGMTQGQLEAILAHEYGHFSNKDTAGGDLALQVRASTNRMAFALAQSGQARWYNPAWLFVNGFIRIFLRITLGASRLQEILADRYAAMAYGAGNMIGGLEHIVRRSLAFPMQVDNEIQSAHTMQRAIGNLYTLPAPQATGQPEQLKAKEEEAMSRPTSPYSSHPSPQDRFALIEHVQTVGYVEENREPVWDLLLDPEALQAEMTAEIQKRLERG